jgi:hypothetical protein
MVALVLCLAMVFSASLALAESNCFPPPTPKVTEGNADGMAAYKGSMTYDQGIYDQQVEQCNFTTAHQNTFQVEKSSFGAFHNGPFNEGKAFDNASLNVTTGSSCTTTIEKVNVQMQGMQGNVAMDQQAATGACATGSGSTVANAGGSMDYVGAQTRTYNLNGTCGGGVQAVAAHSYVGVTTSAGTP